MTMFWKSWVLTLWPKPQGQRVGWVGVLGAKYLVPCCCIEWFPLIWYAKWPCSEKVEFWPIDPIPRVGVRGWVEVCGQNICYHFAAFLILFNLILTWPYSEKVEFWPFDPIPRVGGGGEGVCGQNICYHIAAFVSIKFDMQHDPVLNK